MFYTLAGKRIAIFGFAFKANTGDTRETPANLVVRDLLAEHAYPIITDPKAIENARIELEDVVDQVAFETDPYRASESTHAIIVCTDWLCYQELDWKRIYQSMVKPAVVFDGRNVLPRKLLSDIGFNVKGIGKGIEE